MITSFFEGMLWMSFILFFALFAKSLWFFYYFSMYAFDKKQEYEEFGGKNVLIIPVFNEDEDKLIDTINHVRKCDGINKVVFVNDGSTNNVLQVLRKHNFGYTIVNLKENVGKRKAQKAGLEVVKDADVFVFMDSDTILRRSSVVELLKPMSDELVGGVTAQILCRNKKDNFLTRSIAAMYWSASNIWRQAPSNLGYMQVTNGQLSCYRASTIRQLLPKYVSQTFLGRSCTISDDRWLTHHMQTEHKLKIVYAEKSIAKTYIPKTLRGAYKMFLRWKLGSLRESFLVTKHVFTNPLLVIDIWANHAVALMQTIVRIGILIITIFYPITILYYFGIIVIISLLFAFQMIIKNIKEVPYKICYSLMNEVLFGWVLIHALLTIKNQGKWGTR